MKIELIVFDMAGTTVYDNDDVHGALIKAFKAYGMEISRKAANSVMGLAKPTAIKQLLEFKYAGDRPIDKAFINEIFERFQEEMIAFYQVKENVAEKEGVTETFRALKKKGIKIALDTGFSRKVVEVILENLKWQEDELIDCSVTSDEVVHGRPYPDMIFKAMAETNVNKIKNVVKVGDTVSDIQEGLKAGCGLVIGVTTGADDKKTLKKEKPTHLIEKLTEILHIVS